MNLSNEERTTINLEIESMSEDVQQISATLLDRVQSALVNLSDAQLLAIKSALDRAVHVLAAVETSSACEVIEQQKRSA